MKINLLYIYNPEMGSKSEKNGFWVSAFSPKNLPDPPLGQNKMFSNIGFIVFKRTGFATRGQRSNP